MTRILRWIGIALGGLLVLVLVVVGVLWMLSGRKLAAKQGLPSEPVLVIPTDSASIAGGGRILHSRPCGLCHGEDLGGHVMDDAGLFGILAAPNLTPGRGGRARTDVEWERAIRHGIRRDSTALFIMPSQIFHALSDEETALLIAYLRQMPPVDRVVPPTRFRILGRMLLGAGQLRSAAEESPRSAHVVSVDTATGAEFGRYLAGVAGCPACHGESLSGMASDNPSERPSSNLTPTGLGHYSEEDFLQALRTGARPRGGGPLDEAMPWKYYRHMTDGELRSLWRYLQTLPGREFAEP